MSDAAPESNVETPGGDDRISDDGRAFTPARVQEDLDAAIEGRGDPRVALLEARRMVELLRRGSYAGPLPPPEIIEGYQAAYAGAAEIIFNELKEQGAHRRAIEAKAIDKQETRADRGQWMALGIVVTTLVAAVLCIFEGYPWAGSALFGASLVAIVIAFLTGNRDQERDLARKRRRLSKVLPGNDRLPATPQDS